MAIDFLYPQYEVVRNNDRCINCRACERQCANEVHFWDADNNRMQADESKCVACHRCVALCPTRALKIVKTDHTFRENANWTGKAISEVYRQAGSGGVLLSSMGNPDPHPIYWDKILINASQVTNPSIDPLREPMETKTFLGKKPGKIERDENGNLVPNLAPQLELNLPIMFSAMSYGSISYNAHAALARAASALGTYYNTGEGGLHQDFYQYGPHTIVQVASGRFGVHKDYLEAGAAIEIKMGQGAKPGIGGHLPGLKVGPDISKTRMIPEGTDAISPAPHHDIYSIEDLRQLVYSLKEATEYKKPVMVKIAAVNNVAAVASGVARSGADIICIDGYRAGIHMKAYQQHFPVMVVGGKAGSFLGEYLAGGLILVLGIGQNGAYPVNNFCGTGMHGGKIVLRCDKAPTDLPRQVLVSEVSADDMTEFAPYIKEYAQLFGADAENLLSQKYFVLTPNPEAGYKQLYTFEA